MLHKCIQSRALRVWIVALPLSAACGNNGVQGRTERTPAEALASAVAFVGGEATVDAVTAYEYDVLGARFIDHQGAQPGGPATDAGGFDATVSYSFASDSLRIDYMRAIELFGGAQLVSSEIYNGQLGVVTGQDDIFQPSGDKAMLSSRWASGKKQNLLLNPLNLIKRALADPAALLGVTQTSTGDLTFDVLAISDEPSPIAMWIDQADGRIARVTSMVNDHLMRDSEVEVIFGEWQEAPQGVRFPITVTLSVDGQVLHTESRLNPTSSPTFGSTRFEFPQNVLPPPTFDTDLASWGTRSHTFAQKFASIGLTQDLRQLLVTSTEISPGIWFITGATHNSMAVEQENGVVIVEAPLYPERADAIIAWAQTQFPAKPVTHVVATHHHADHTGGLRSFVAAGATVIVHEDADEFLADVFDAVSSIAPDALAANPTAAAFLQVPDAGTITLGDPTNPVEVHSIVTSHASDMVVALVPDTAGGGHLFESDLYLPGNGGSAIEVAYAQELQTALADIDASILVGGHGGIAPVSELQSFVSSL